MRIIVHAPNVHHGGGRTLLAALLGALGSRGGVALIDHRLKLDDPLPGQVQTLRFRPSFRDRLAAEWALARLARPDDLVLCFGNLPPLLHLRARVCVLVQNRYLVAPIELDDFHPRTRLRIAIERLWLRYRLRNAEVIVQTPSMAHDVSTSLGVTAMVAPFAPEPDIRAKLPARQFLHDFVYVASGEPHKNHRRLVQAWVELARRGHFPSLCLTLDPLQNAPLLRWIEEQRSRHALHIVNVGQLGQVDIQALYASSSALIYPSLIESFGLPLLEAQSAGLPIVAAECDYVRDVVAPAESFDPMSPVSIARAIQRHLKVSERATTPVSAAAFVERLLQQTEPELPPTKAQTASDR